MTQIPPNYSDQDWERIGNTPGGGSLSRLKIHNGWLVREVISTSGGGAVALTFVPFTPYVNANNVAPWRGQAQPEEPIKEQTVLTEQQTPEPATA